MKIRGRCEILFKKVYYTSQLLPCFSKVVSGNISGLVIKPDNWYIDIPRAIQSARVSSLTWCHTHQILGRDAN